MRANYSLCAPHLLSVIMLQNFVKQTTKGNKRTQKVQDPLLKKIFFEDNYREIMDIKF